MANTNNKIRTSELDFDQIKENLKEYMRGQSEFSDYDFEGSALSVLLDVLAYNTHYNALYTNLAINEAFLDSASKRASVVSKAKEIGYVPASSKSATAIVDIVAINNQIEAPTLLEIPQYSTFSSSVDGVEYTFYTLARHTATKVSNQYVFSDIMLKEGSLLEFRFEVTNTTPVFTLPNANIDTSTLRVLVQENGQSTTSETFINAASLLDVTPNTPAYFLREVDNELYTIEFGNGIIGKGLTIGNVVTVTYIACNRDLPNGARTFKYNGALSSQNQIFVTTVTPAFGGTAPESIEDIKWNAPRSYAAQNRCVTVDDYRAIIRQYYQDARSVNVWGGETANPPQYGKVFISIITESPSNLTDEQKNFILNTIVNPRKPLTVVPEIVDPTPINMELDVAVYFDRNKTTRSAGDIKTLVEQTITDYNNLNLNKFNGIFKLSQLSRQIDEAEESILSNVTKIKLRREVQIIFNQLVAYEVNLGNPIYKDTVASDSVTSTGFYLPNDSTIYYLDDVPNDTPIGDLRMYSRSPLTGEKIFVRNVGTVEYGTGKIRIDDISIDRLATLDFIFTIVPDSYDVVSSQNQFVLVDFSRLNVNVIVESSVTPYTFVSNRF
jgi:hypothetical protein